MTGRRRCRAPSAPHPRGPCDHPYRDHPGVLADGPGIGLPGERVLSEGMGGEVAALVRRTRGAAFEGPCGHAQSGDRWLGYPDHEAGIADGSGRKWWAYVRCPTCVNEAAFWKVERRIRELPPPAAGA